MLADPNEESESLHHSHGRPGNAQDRCSPAGPSPTFFHVLGKVYAAACALKLPTVLERIWEKPTSAAYITGD